MAEVDNVGLESVSRALLNKVTHYHAQIGHNVDKSKLYELEYKLLRDAKTLYHSHKWEDALNTFAQVLAIVEKTRTTQDHATRGAIVHNIGSCLHNLGEFDAAQAYYEQAVDSFRKSSSPLVDRLFYGDINRRRIEFVKERLIDISWGRKPDEDKFLNEFGYKRDAPKPAGEERGGAAALSRDWENETPPPPAWMEPTDSYESKPAWLMNMDRYGGGARSAAEGSTAHWVGRGGESTMSEGERRAAFQECLQRGDWVKADNLVATDAEREDLDYLRERERRVGSNAIAE